MRIVLNTEIESKEKFDFSLKLTARKVIRASLRQEGFPADAELSLLITDDNGIRTLNREFRGIDRETDVLSFPSLTYERPSDFGMITEDPEDCTDPANGCVVLGDIVINTARVKKQAAEYGHSEEREFAFLVAHSMMHLCGYDHMTEPEAREMERRQESVLENLGITREQ